ncbi:methylated-DNA--[protein]-cysteine S-methyltransferase [Aestuariispira insulae]|uniref:Methylated-DNA--protein-cysteine methyltransferase n=1 Tax=Aestuariispira insulae TaxID=1461337 RepID=A0A3D9HXM5_9PROT|nr:methylated-DNA--[protein]-cysteine S-methyltransferase [Aestuariispira insulae]RED54170.1 methylated-DNA-[protein]-cysteine S-methyltransferase [Aestuariispira insulae]
MELAVDIVETPIGKLSVVAEGDQLCHLDFENGDVRMATLLKRRYGAYQLTPKENAAKMRDRLAAYFNGDWSSLMDLKCKTGGTEFQKTVWNALCEIPRGETWSYAELADHIGNPSAVRAVARANALNPISIFIPCHRVIGKDGTLTGYAGGLDRKEYLLRHEGALLV